MATTTTATVASLHVMTVSHNNNNGNKKKKSLAGQKRSREAFEDSDSLLYDEVVGEDTLPGSASPPVLKKCKATRTAATTTTTTTTTITSPALGSGGRKTPPPILVEDAYAACLQWPCECKVSENDGEDEQEEDGCDGVESEDDDGTITTTTTPVNNNNKPPSPYDNDDVWHMRDFHSDLVEKMENELRAQLMRNNQVLESVREWNMNLDRSQDEAEEFCLICLDTTCADYGYPICNQCGLDKGCLEGTESMARHKRYKELIMEICKLEEWQLFDKEEALEEERQRLSHRPTSPTYDGGAGAGAGAGEFV